MQVHLLIKITVQINLFKIVSYCCIQNMNSILGANLFVIWHFKYQQNEYVLISKNNPITQLIPNFVTNTAITGNLLKLLCFIFLHLP